MPCYKLSRRVTVFTKYLATGYCTLDKTSLY
nr:MAG TPA: hypothetical protein [Caudoviricetes sp.]